MWTHRSVTRLGSTAVAVLPITLDVRRWAIKRRLAKATMAIGAGLMFGLLAVVSGCGPAGVTLVGPSIGYQCPSPIVGRPVTETVTVTGGTVPCTLQWVLDGSVVPPADFDVESTSYDDSGGKGVRATFTVTPSNVNDLLVLNVHGDDPWPATRAKSAIGAKGSSERGRRRIRSNCCVRCLPGCRLLALLGPESSRFPWLGPFGGCRRC